MLGEAKIYGLNFSLAQSAREIVSLKHRRQPMDLLQYLQT